ncbi:MAG: hypothetical protein JO075_14900, partial [Acidimicrobiia bacterium]|nr:hypothetical protein [Acidimicrobiia bacterium]
MSMLRELVRGRLRIPLLWILIALVLGAGVITWATRGDNGRGTHAATGVAGALAPA